MSDDGTTIAAGTSVLVNDPEGKAVAFLQFQGPGTRPVCQGDETAAMPTLIGALLYLRLRAKGIINADGTFVGETEATL